MLSFADEPHGDSSCVPTWLVCKRGARVGDGRALRRRRRRVVRGIRLAVRGAARARAGAAARAGLRPARGVPPMSRLWPQERAPPAPLEARRACSRARARAPPPRTRPIARSGAPRSSRAARTPELAASCGVGSIRGTRSRPLFERCEGADPLEALLFLDRHTYLAEGVLAKVDRMSMAHGLEVRSPLLDHEVVELSLRVGAADKIRGGRPGKRILRRLADELLPPEVVAAEEDRLRAARVARGSADRSGRSSSGRCCARTRSWRRSSASPCCAAWSAEHQSGARATTARSSGRCSRSRSWASRHGGAS